MSPYCFRFCEPQIFRSLCVRGTALWVGFCLAAGLGWGLADGQEAEEANDEVAAEAPDEIAPDARPGRLLRLRLPITGNADSAFRSMVDRTKNQLLAEAAGDTRPTIVIEFAPIAEGDGFGQGTDFARALSLARYLTSDQLTGVKTVAFLPRTVKGHGVLVALACEEIAMAPTAELGEAGVDEDATKPIEPTIAEGYRQIAQTRRTAPEAIAVGMLDRDLEVLEVETESGIEFVDRADLDKLEEREQVVRTTPLFPKGTLGSITAREGRQFGVVKYVAADRRSLAKLLRVDPKSLAEDSGVVADWRPIIYTIDQSIDGGLQSRSVRYVDGAIGEKQANWVGFRISSVGGSPTYGQQLASYITSLSASEIRTVGYVPTEARGIAAVVALSCDQLVIHDTAEIGGNAAGLPEFDDESLEALRISIKTLSNETGRTHSLLMSLLDPDVELYRYTNRQTGEERLFSADEASDQPDAGDWRQGDVVSPKGKLLLLDSDSAEALGVASHVVTSYEGLKQIYGFEDDPFEVKPTWSGEVAEVLATPAMAVLLLFVAFLGVYFELHTPGFGVGGFVAALCILLFFWSRGFDGDVGWLEVFLFLGGVVAILVEIFVLPGVGIFGLGGTLMVVLSLVLAGQRRLIPRTAEDFADLQTSLTVVTGAAVLMVISSLFLRRYLPSIPVLNKLMLAPPDVMERAEIEHRESLAEYTHLIGQRGTTTTPLMPSGRAEIEGELVDVAAEKGTIDAGALVEVVSAKGNHVVVRAI